MYNKPAEREGGRGGREGGDAGLWMMAPIVPIVSSTVFCIQRGAGGGAGGVHITSYTYDIIYDVMHI